MSFIDDFSLSNYETIDELKEARGSIEVEISGLNGYIRGIDEKIEKLQDIADDEAEYADEDEL